MAGLATSCEVLWKSKDSRFMAVNKPAGLSCSNDPGSFGNIGKVLSGAPSSPLELRGKNWTCGHRLDLCVSGVLLLGNTAGAGGTITKVLNPRRPPSPPASPRSSPKHSFPSSPASPTAPSPTSPSPSPGLSLGSVAWPPESTELGHHKEYVARVAGEVKQSGVFEIRTKLKVSGGKTLVVTPDTDIDIASDDGEVDAMMEENKGGTPRLEAVTFVKCMSYDAASDTSFLRVKLRTGQRHQIRAHLEHIGHPIVNDTKYGWARPLWPGLLGQLPSSPDALRLYRDDEKGSLLAMLTSCKQEWCGACNSLIDTVRAGGTSEGAHKLTHFICLHAWHYSIPELVIDVTAPVPWWVDSPPPAAGE